jgi:hypothetical protein
MADKDKYADEIMSDEELDKVAGGTPGELADDSRFLNVLLQGTNKYHQCDRYCGGRIFFDSSAFSDIVNSWKSLGIEIKYSAFVSNDYMLYGKKISREEAWAHAEKLVGKHLTEAQWNW